MDGDNEVGLPSRINPARVRHNQTNEGDCAISWLITVTVNGMDETATRPLSEDSRANRP